MLSKYKSRDAVVEKSRGFLRGDTFECLYNYCFQKVFLKLKWRYDIHLALGNS